MLNPYYSLWADAIIYEQTKNSFRRDWKFFTLVPISMFMGLNYFTVSIFLGKYFDVWIIYFINLNVFGANTLNKALSGLITVLIPFLILNYFLIFFKRRYEVILNKFKYREGKMYKSYLLISLILLWALLLFIYFTQ